MKHNNRKRRKKDVPKCMSGVAAAVASTITVTD